MPITLKGASAELVGVSTDTKPVEAEQNQIFHELDTNDFYYFDGETWSKVGGEANAEG